jgi:hypothetical protein
LISSKEPPCALGGIKALKKMKKTIFIFKFLYTICFYLLYLESADFIRSDVS